MNADSGQLPSAQRVSQMALNDCAAQARGESTESVEGLCVHHDLRRR